MNKRKNTAQNALFVVEHIAKTMPTSIIKWIASKSNKIVLPSWDDSRTGLAVANTRMCDVLHDFYPDEGEALYTTTAQTMTKSMFDMSSKKLAIEWGVTGWTKVKDIHVPNQLATEQLLARTVITEAVIQALPIELPKISGYSKRHANRVIERCAKEFMQLARDHNIDLTQAPVSLSVDPIAFRSVVQQYRLMHALGA